ncbi:MAG: electron transport complex subunit RsxC [Thermodesulfobacteriota bacterium]|nr:electron transport complex subunit RsxC [Thermodesulfobacteriota bacterium]
MKTFKKGGVHPPGNKITADVQIETLPTPGLLKVLLSQHLGKPAKPVVKKAELVKKGQLVAEADSFISAHIHAPTSGKVMSVDERSSSPGGQYSQAIVIEADGQEEWAEGLNVDIDYVSLSREEKLRKIQDAGIVGMGGAGFPSHVKLNPPKDKKIDTLILNGAECEPFLTPDYRLLLEKPANVIKGLGIVASLFDENLKVYIGIEKNKLNAIRIMKKHSKETPYEVVPLKTKYPQGSEKQLINAITKRTLAVGQLPFDVGCLVHNISTVYAIYEAVAKNKPLIERVLSVSGMSIQNAKNLRATLGTSIADIADYCGGLKGEINQLIVGGPMMGKAQYTLDVPITKTTSGILFINNKELDSLRERACIRCGKCVDVCPQSLQPWRFVDLAQNRRIDEIPLSMLNDCMECGSCTFVCPVRRNIVHWIKYAKAINARRKG